MDKLHSLGFLLNRASFMLEKNMRAQLKQDAIDLTHSQFVVLRCLYYTDSISQQQLSHLLGKDASAIMRTIDGLESKQFVERTAVNQRENAILITQAGRKIYPLAQKSGDKVIVKVKEQLGNERYKQLKEILEQMYDNIGE